MVSEQVTVAKRTGRNEDDPSIAATQERGAQATTVRPEDDGRFEVRVDDTVAGFTEFFEHDGKRVFYHTEIGEEWGGRGLAKTLASNALDQTRADGLRIVAICPFIKSYLSKNHDYDDIVDPVSADIAKVYKANYQA